MENNSQQRDDPSNKPSQTHSFSLLKLFKFADTTDMWLVALGTAGAIGDGVYLSVLQAFMSNLTNTIGNGPASYSAESLENINKFSFQILFLSVGVGLAAFLEAFCWTRTAKRQTCRMRREYLKAVLRQEVGFFDVQGTTTSEVVTSVSNDTLVIQDVLSEKIPNFVMNFSCFLSCYIVAFYLAWRLAIVGFPLALLLIIPGIMYGRILVGIATKMHQTYNKADIVAQEALSSIRTVFSFGGEERTMHKFAEELNGTVKLGIKQGLVKGMAVGSNGLTLCIWAFVSWYGSRLVMHNHATGGQILSSSVCLLMGSLALGSAIPNIKDFSEAYVAAQRMIEMTDRVPIIDSGDSSGQILNEVYGEVEFRNVKFAYPSRTETLVFHNFSLTIPANKAVALVGGSGSGKSTAIALLERFYDPLSGQILLDGINIMTLQLKWLRSRIGLVSQEPALFATSIRENILFGKEGATMDEAIAAAQVANAHKFITQLPNGYDTQVGDGGMQLSGGQKQRIAIARAIVRDPRILVLDEATSAIDAESEKIVQDALDQASIGRTTLVIAHRLSTIRNADLIAVVQDGHITESGTHEDLISRKHGAYSTLVQLQQASAKADPSAPISSYDIRSRNPTLATRSSSELSDSAVQAQFEHDKKKLSSARPSCGRLVLLNIPEWKQALLGCAGAIVIGAVQPTYAFINGSVASAYFLQDHDEIESKITKCCLVFLGLGVSSFLSNVVQHYNFAAMGEYLTRRVRERMLSKVFTFEVGWFDREENSSGALCARLAKEANVVRSIVGDRLSLIVQTVSTVGLAFTIGLILAWRLAVVMIAVQPLIITCFYSRKVILKTMSKMAAKAHGQGSQVASEAVSNHRTITAFSSQQRILTLFESTHRKTMKESWIAGLVLGTSQLLALCNTSLSLWYGGHLVYNGRITFESFYQTYFILMSTGRVVAEAGTMTSDIAKGSYAVKSMFDILDRETLINPDDDKGEKPHKIQGNIYLKKVGFAYPCRPDNIIFKDLTLGIKAGNTVALVGESGSGKSTIIGLIERFYDPLEGVVRIDGKDIRTFNLRSLRQHMALVAQEPTLFGGSIRYNICYGKENATEAEMIEAAKAANAHDFISCLKDGYDTESGDRGVQLSGGQKQRIAIARAIIKNPSVLLLDEATSALDAQSEKVVQEALDRVMVGRTSVIVAHRLSTIRNADSIVVIKDGRVVEHGNHSRLMSKGESSPYFSMVRMQSYHKVTS